MSNDILTKLIEWSFSNPEALSSIGSLIGLLLHQWVAKNRHKEAAQQAAFAIETIPNETIKFAVKSRIADVATKALKDAASTVDLKKRTPNAFERFLKVL